MSVTNTNSQQNCAWTTPEWLADEGGVTRECARRWVRRYGLGRKIAGRYRVDLERAREFLKGTDYAQQTAQ